MKKTAVIFSMMIVVMALLVTGCVKEPGIVSDNGDDNSETEPMKLIAIGECTFAPFEFMDEETGKPVGFDVDLIKAIAEAMNFEVEYKNMDWNSLIAALQTKEADLVVSGVTINDERALEVKFSDPYFESGQVWCVESDSSIKTLNDLSGHTVAVQINTTADYAAQKIDAKFKDDGNPGLNIKRLDQAADVFNELKVGGVDAVIADLPLVQEYLKNNPDSNVIIPEPAFTVEYYGIAMRKQDKEIHEIINKGLATIKASGVYDELYQKYFDSK